MALLSRRVEVPEQRQNLAQKASYVVLFRNMCASGEGNARKPGGVRGACVEEDIASRRHCVEKTLRRDLVLVLEPTMSTKVAWAEPDHAGKEANSKSTGEVQALSYSRAVHDRNPPMTENPPCMLSSLKRTRR